MISQAQSLALAACGVALITGVTRAIFKPHPEHPKWRQAVYRQAPLIFIAAAALLGMLIEHILIAAHRGL